MFHAVVPHMLGAMVQNLVVCSTWLSGFVHAFGSPEYKSEALPLHINLFGRPILITPEATIKTCGKWRCGSSQLQSLAASSPERVKKKAGGL